MDNEEVQIQISNMVKGMDLSSPAEKALIGSTIKLYNELKSKSMHYKTNIRHRIATAVYLACDKHACIATRKVKRACGDSLRTRYIMKARKALGQPPATAHEKLNSLCEICDICDNEVTDKAHSFISLLEGHKSYSPSTMAATAFYEAQRQVYFPDHLRYLTERMTQNEICKLTGGTEFTIRECGKDLHLRQPELGVLKE